MSSNEAEQEASEVLHSLLSIERVRDASGLAIPSGEIRSQSECGIDDGNEERQNETVDIETIEDYSPKYAANNLPTNSNVPVDQENNYDSSDAEDDTPECVELRLKQGCDCKFNCFKDLDAEQVYRHRLNIAELTKDEHDMYLMGVTMACVANVKKTSRQKERQRNRATYVYQGKRVCLDSFLFLENVTLYHIKRIRNHVLKHGVVPRTHGNFGKKPHNTFSLDMYKNLENYIKKFLQPHVVDFNKNQVVYGITRVDIYNSYKDHGRKADEKLVGYSTFRRFMKKQFPQIKFQKVDHSGRHVAVDGGTTPKTPKKKQQPTKVHTSSPSNVTRIDKDVIMEVIWQ